jgi:hypothetical protein
MRLPRRLEYEAPRNDNPYRMNDQELLKSLNNLKQIKPDSDWKKQYRDILFSQISAGQQDSEVKSNIWVVWESIMPRQIILNLAKPVWLASIASVFILVIGIGGVYASKNSKPGDSLYIAKIISEKAQFAMTFDEKDKAKLGVEFATNRAKEMIQVLEDTNQTATINNVKLEKLSQNFKKEISQVKSRLTIINTGKNQIKEEESEVFGANLGKNDQRMEIAEPVAPAGGQVNPAGEPEKTGTSNRITGTSTAAHATSTAVNAGSIDSSSTGQAGQMLEEAEKLVDEKNIDGAINKLEEVNKAIDRSESGQVKGESETASSTD